MYDSTGNFDLSHSKSCNRYQSRGGRRIILQQLIPILRSYSSWKPLNQEEKLHSYKSEYWNVLTNVIDKYSSLEGQKCILDPRTDILFDQEVNSKSIPRHQGSIHKCEYCSKKFVTKYYLDLHLHLKHSHDDNIPKIPHSTCIASDVCPAFGGVQICEENSNKDEPFYGRGDGKRIGEDAVRRKKQCDEEEMKLSRDKCYSLMNDCFRQNSNLVEDLSIHFCDRLTCKHALQSLIIDVSSSQETFSYHIHHIKKLWDEHEEHNVGIFGTFVIFLVVLFYIVVGIGYCCNFSKNQISTLSTPKKKSFLRTRKSQLEKKLK